MEIAALGLRVDGVDNIGKASQNLDDLKKSAHGAEGSLDSLSGDATKATKSIKEVGDQSDRSSSKISALGGVAKAAGGVIVAAFSVAKVAQYADAWSDMQSRVGAATGSMDTAGESMKRLLQIANASYSPLSQTSEIYSRNVSTFRDLGRSASDAADFTESLNNMLVLTATRGERAASVQNALSKAMAVGKLQADGLETVLANGGEVAQALATKLGTTVSGLRDMASQGKITGDVIASSIVGSLDDVRARAEEMPATLGDAFVRVGNNVTAFVGQMDQAAGTTSALAAKIVELADAALEVGTKAIKVLSDNIDTIANTIILATKLTAAYVVAVYAIPAAKMAASAATTAYTAVLRLFSAQVALTTKTLLSMRTALNVVFAAFAGWEIGTYLRNEFEVVEKAGIALMGGLHTVAVTIAGEFAIMGERVKFALTNPFDFARGVIADFFGWIAGLGASALKLIGFEDLAAGIDTEFKGIRGAVGSEHAAMLKEMRATTQAEVAGINDIYAEMFADVGKGGKEAAGTVDEIKEKTKELGGEIKKVDVGKLNKAFGDLMARLFPAQAAQAKYNAELAILTKHLRGNQLAKAVGELTKQFTGGDADGAAKAIEEYNKNLKTLVDRLNPAAVAARTFREEQDLLLDAIARTGDPTGELARSLATLDQQYAETSRTTSEWTKWTESALDRVDSAFADAWRNIGEGFKGFRDNLTNAFKQMLAELAHMAITKPIVMQIGAALGIGGGGAGTGIGGMLSSAIGGSGGISLGQLASYGQSAYSALTGWGPAALAGYQSGGIWGGAQAVGSYYGNMIGNAASTVGGWLGMGGASTGAGAAGTGFGLGGSLVSGEIGSAAYAGGQAGAASGAQGALGSLGPAAGAVVAAYIGYQGYQSYRAGARPDASPTRDNAAAWMSGYQFISELHGAINKLTKAVGLDGTFVGGIVNAFGTFFSSVGSKLFGGSWQTKDGGLSLGVQGGDFAGQQYEFQKKKGGLFRSNKKRTRYSALDADTAAFLEGAYDATEDSVAALYEQLGYTIDEATLSGLSIGATQISTMGKTGEQIEEAIGEWLGTVAESMNTEMQKVFATGLDYDLAGMQEFVGNLLGVNEVLRYLDVGMFDASVAGGKLAETLSGLAGGLDALSANAATYYDNFFSAEEKTEDAIDAITRTFKDAEVTLTDSREAYRKAVEAIDMTSEAGQIMFTKMMALAGTAAQYFDIIEQQAALAAQAAAQAAQAAQQAAVNSVNASMAQANSAYSTLERSIAAERKRITAEFNAAAQAQQAASQASSQAAARISQAQSASLTASMDISKRLIDIFRQIDSAVKSALDRLMSTDTAVVSMRREQSLSVVRSALASGSLADIDGLTDAITTSSIIDSASYKTAVELQREQGRTANLISDLGELNGKQLSAEEKIYDRLSAQLDYTRSISSSVSSGFSGVSSSLQAKYDADMAALDEELEAAKLQMDALNSVDNSIMNVQAAVDQMSAAVVAAMHQQNKFMSGDTSKTDLGSSAATSSDAGLEATIKRMYQSTLGYEADKQGVKHWTDRIKSGESLSVLQNALTRAAAAAAAPKIPAFASGGFHSGGLRIVGENGPELEATGSARIFNAAQTEQILSGGRSNDSTSSAITRLEGTIAQQAEALRAIAKHTRKTSQQTEMLERWDFDGLPQERNA